MSSTFFVNPKIKHAILVEPTRIVGRTLRSERVNIEPERPLQRLLGGYVVYFSDALPFALDRGKGWERGRKLVLMRPYEQHWLLRCQGLRTILIEPESVCSSFMEDQRWSEGTEQNRRWAKRIERGFDAWATLGIVPDKSVDESIFGENLPARQLNARIASVITEINACPSGSQSSVTMLARHIGLSTSRLSHLFREQLGIPIRSFRAWKRVRNSIALTVSEPLLLNAALNAGYADEPHYSRSMRKYFGQHAHLMKRHWSHAMTFRTTDTHCV